MIGKSIKFQFGMMGVLFAVFGVAVIVQMFYVNRQQVVQLNQISQTHRTVASFLKLEDEEQRILLNIRIHIANQGKADSAAKLDQLDAEIAKWFSRISIWMDEIKNLNVGGNESVLGNSVFSQKYLSNKKRQANAYRHVVQCCRDNKFDEAQHVLNIEAHFQSVVQDSVNLISRKIEKNLEDNLQQLRKIFLVLAIGCLAILALLIVVGTGIYRSLIGSINKMDMAIKRIAGGNFTSGVKITSPGELAFLANSFNNMQNTIKVRDSRIHEDAEDIKKINEFLEQKVISNNRTIEQQEIALKRKNEEIDMTLQMMAEELSSRLNEVSQSEDLLKKIHNRASLPEDVVSGIENVNAGLKNLSSMSRQLAELACIGREAMHVQHLPMAAVLKNICDHLRFHLGMAGAKLLIRDDIIDCQGDGSMIEQAFVKLVENALKYRAPERDCLVKIESESDILFLRYKVIDNGIGIPKEYQEKIFQAFFRINHRDEGGEGLGLAIVHRIVTLHNGRIWVESEPGKGSTFIIELPKQQGH